MLLQPGQRTSCPRCPPAAAATLRAVRRGRRAALRRRVCSVQCHAQAAPAAGGARALGAPPRADEADLVRMRISRCSLPRACGCEPRGGGSRGEGLAAGGADGVGGGEEVPAIPESAWEWVAARTFADMTSSRVTAPPCPRYRIAPWTPSQGAPSLCSAV
eukprot:1192851-Prorocentrum_minimum.AAC.4